MVSSAKPRSKIPVHARVNGFVEQYKEQFAIAALCRVMQVSRSGYHAWVNRRESASLGKREASNQILLKQICTAFVQGRKDYGSPRIHQALRKQGVVCGKNRVARF